jgi:glutathionylspermidine synthase
MKRVPTQERPNWMDAAEEIGFNFHTMYGEPYWDEKSMYQFTLEQVENDIEDPSTELHEMCRQAVDEIVDSERLMTKMGIPSNMMAFVRNSWKRDEQELYGRFDLAYDGNSPAKMLEYNADTPTSLFEASHFQWKWLEEKIKLGHLPENSDQFNRIYDALVERFQEMFLPDENVHFASVGGIDNLEDYGTVETMGWAASDAGLIPHYVKVEDIGLSDAGQFADDQNRVIGSLFKLYPWEDMLRDEYAVNLASSRCRMIEPAWKAVVSNKGILPVLWKMFPGHKNLLPAYWADESHNLTNYVTKPIFSREGASITIVENGKTTESSTNREYDHNLMIVQEYCALPVFDGYRPIIGSWIVGRMCVGMGIREDQSRITQDLSRFKPHIILN